MSKKLICPNCEKERLVEPIDEERTIEVRNENILVHVTLWRCLECGEEIEDPENPADELDEAYRKYRAHHKMLQPEQIRSLRDNLDLTQIELANILGFSHATISRYENGALQEQSHDNMLQMLNEPSHILMLLERSSKAFDPHRFKEIAKHLKISISSNRNNYFIQDLESRDVGHFSGYTSFNIEKYIAVAQRIIKYCEGSCPKTKLNKLFFYSDFYSTKKHDVSITGSRYTHEQYGPCPKDFQFLLGYMSEEGFVEIDEKPVKDKDYCVELITVKNGLDEGVLTNQEKKIIDHICKIYGKKYSGELTKNSHEEKAYRATELYDPISYEYAKYLNTR